MTTQGETPTIPAPQCTAPAVVIEIGGGLIHRVVSNVPIRVVTHDSDADDAEDEDLVKVFGRDAIVADQSVEVDDEYLAAVLAVVTGGTDPTFIPAVLDGNATVVRLATQYINDHRDVFDRDPEVTVADAVSYALNQLGIGEPDEMNDELGDLYDAVHDAFASDTDAAADTED